MDLNLYMAGKAKAKTAAAKPNPFSALLKKAGTTMKKQGVSASAGKGMVTYSTGKGVSVTDSSGKTYTVTDSSGKTYTVNDQGIQVTTQPQQTATATAVDDFVDKFIPDVQDSTGKPVDKKLILNGVLAAAAGLFMLSRRKR